MVKIKRIEWKCRTGGISHYGTARLQVLGVKDGVGRALEAASYLGTGGLLLLPVF